MRNGKPDRARHARHPPKIANVPFVKQASGLLIAVALACSTNAQICGQMFIALESMAYDARLTYVNDDGTVCWESELEDTNYLLIPSCHTQSNYAVELFDDGQLLDRFVILYEDGIPVISHPTFSGLIQSDTNSY